MVDWYKPDYMGTLADWVGIIATIGTILLTMRYYFNDNKKDFKIVFYPLYSQKKEEITYYSSEIKRFEFYAVNFSKSVDLVYFYTIKTKANFLVRKLSGIPIEHLNWNIFSMDNKPNYQVVESRNYTKVEKFQAHWFFDHALMAYKKTRNKRFLKNVGLEIIYVNVEGKEFNKVIKFPVTELINYEKSKKGTL